jgi:hypothetical protein
MHRLYKHLARVLAAFALLGAASSSCFGQTPLPLRCAGPEYRQFDFWAGDWNAYDADQPSKPAAMVKVDVILGGCVLRETYEGANGLVGQSFSIYDASRKVWHQSWVTNHGQLLVLEGDFRDGRMTLRARETVAGGRQVLWRGVWIARGDGVRETAVTSEDGGKTWKPKFDLLFRRRKA